MKFDFDKCIKDGVEQAMKECELTIGMTLKEAVEKQIPKKALDIEGDYTALYGSCPNCKNIVCDNEDYKYCNECGQALDWSDTE